ncbi:type II toxin-antitoxin system YoeB family toxin [Candidatus Odyssella acanthamoebae]|uniref:Uncharacterized protein n=1 Tax=Candidatus Odyssella acanthamoebae TaxID=91604 RepID=A0A077AWW8_9PROT|nr:type II toxin-antitoxin system YoeB family toxin [Candidatus Paracaedibacter acanthamoebae]AIK96128.1 hypothetical protein ID47_04280 [Candidatus Paracaedibacter acanthamoebae]
MNRFIFSLLATTFSFLISSGVLGMDHPKMNVERVASQFSSFSNPELFQFPFLQEGREDKDQGQQKTQEGIRAKIQGDGNLARESFLEASALGSEAAMTQLGHIALGERNYQESFHWYNLAQHTSFLKTGTYSQGPSATGILKAGSQDPSLLNPEYLLLIKGFNRYDFSKHPTSVRAQFLLSQLCEKLIVYPSSPLNDNLYWGLAMLGNEPVLWERLGWLYEAKKLGPSLNEADRYQQEANCFWHSKTPEGWYALGDLIFEKQALHTLDGKRISNLERPLLAAECYRHCGLPKGLFMLGVMIHNKEIHRDENNEFFEEKDRDKVTARCLLKAGMPMSFYHIAELLKEKKIKCDTKGKFIDTDVPESFYAETAAFYCRKANLPVSRLALAGLIVTKAIKTDEKGKKITSEREYFSAVARCLEGLKREDFSFESDLKSYLTNLGAYIEQGILTYDEKGKKIKSEKQRGEIAAAYLREAGTPLALSNLSGLILQKLTDLDEFGNNIHTDEERFQTAERCSSSHYPYSIYNLALITLYRYPYIVDYKERALRYAFQAIVCGDDAAIDLYIQIKKEIEKASQPLKKEETKNLETEINKSSHQPLEEEEDAYSETVEDEITPAGRQKMKEITKKLKNHRVNYKKLVHRQISTKEFNDLLKNQNRDTQRGFQITWSDKAIKQFQTLPTYEAKKVNYLIQLIKEGDIQRGRPETLKDKNKIITRRIDKGDRLAYKLTENGIHIISTKGHIEK